MRNGRGPRRCSIPNTASWVCLLVRRVPAKTAVCVVDRDGVVLWQGKVPSEPGPLVRRLAEWSGTIDLAGIGAGEQPYRAAVEARIHAVAVQPLRTFRRLVDQRGELWLDWRYDWPPSSEASTRTSWVRSRVVSSTS